jgi:molybdate transport system ATP-binding protein
MNPDEGRVQVGERLFFDSHRGVNVSMEDRNVGYVFQDYALFPHLTVYENVAFGLRARGAARAQIHARVTAELERLGIAHLARERPGRLSAGQRQRVALGRTLITQPDVLLLDEPLSALDMQLRARIRGELKSLLRQLSIPTVIVTHDPLDAIGLGDEIAVIEQGRIIQRGSYEALLSRPSSRFVAEFVESNAYVGTQRAASDGSGEVLISVAEGVDIRAAPQDLPERVLAVIHPWDIVLFDAPPTGSLRNVFKGPVLSICPLRDRVRVMVDIGVMITAEVTPSALATLNLREGQPIQLGFKAAAVRTFGDQSVPGPAGLALPH